MGYDIHITRRASWTDEGDDIGDDEWRTYVSRDKELRLDVTNGPSFAVWSGGRPSGEHWMDWADGNIYSKNPSPALIDKMVAIARDLGATVQGDDGEIYESGSEPPRDPTISLRQRLHGWFRRLLPAGPLNIDHSAFPFREGDQALDVWGQEVLIIEVNPNAEHGLGTVRFRHSDGRELTAAMIAHGLKKIEPKSPA